MFNKPGYVLLFELEDGSVVGVNAEKAPEAHVERVQTLFEEESDHDED